MQLLKFTRFIHLGHISGLKHPFFHINKFHSALSMTMHGSVRGAKLNLRVMGEVSLLFKWIIAHQLPGWGKR